MTEEKKSRYTASQKKAAEKYLSEKVEDIRIRVPKGQKAIIKAHAESVGESLNQFVIRAIEKAMRDDKVIMCQKAETEWQESKELAIQEGERVRERLAADGVLQKGLDGNSEDFAYIDRELERRRVEIQGKYKEFRTE